MLYFKNFRKIYGKCNILEISDLEIEENLVWIRGANGSGKSKLLKSIAGIIPFSGDIFLDNISLKENPVAVRRKISYAEAEPLFPEILSGREIIDFVANTRNANQEGVEKLVNFFNADSFLNHACGGYSTGMLKKISLIMAFLGDPEWILLDEPFAFIRIH